MGGIWRSHEEGLPVSLKEVLVSYPLAQKGKAGPIPDCAWCSGEFLTQTGEIIAQLNGHF